MTPKLPGEPGFRFWWHRVVCDMPADVINTEARALAGVLVLYANDAGVCWPSRETLADDLAVTARSIARRAQALEAAGLLARSTAHRGRTTTYRLLVPDCLPQRTLERLGKGVASVNHSTEVDEERVTPASTISPERLTSVTERLTSASTRTPSEPTYPEPPTLEGEGQGEGGAYAPGGLALADIDLGYAADWINATLDRLPDEVRQRFDADWDRLRADDPAARERALTTVARVLSTHGAVGGERLAAAVLYPEGDPTGRWSTAGDVARVVLRRLHAAARQIAKTPATTAPPADTTVTDAIADLAATLRRTTR